MSNAPRLRIPDELVELEAQAHLLAVAQNPFRKLARLEPAEDGRENDFFHVVAEPLLLKEVARVKVVRLVQNDEFDLVLAFERLEVSETESVALPAPRALDVHDLHDGLRELAHKAFAAGFDENTKAGIEQAGGKRHDLFFLEQRLASGKFCQLPAHAADTLEDGVWRDLQAPVECIRRVTPVAAQVTPRQPDKDARQAGESGLTLNGLEYFRHHHFEFPALAPLDTF